MPANVIIYRPSKNAMQSGMAGTHRWIMRFEKSHPKFIEPMMGWVGSCDTTQQLRMYFKSREDAIAYAKRKGFNYSVTPPHERKIRPKSYAANFACHKIQYNDPL